MVGQTISHYDILEKLGAGGMGDIYKAQDTRLNRFVAVKVLSQAGSGEGTGRRRFLQEAQAASALNHPNIITIHDIVSQDHIEFMVMEYVSGKTLADLIPPGGLGIRDALRFGVQIADALQAAHAAGIVHRDLKPGNVMVTNSGLVKVLDFGLAKFTVADSITQLTDITVTHVEAPLTVKGSIIGTVSYMSPEQAQGKAVDQRSDIFSFGVLLYEMVTGNRAFQSDSAISTLSSILRDDVRPMAELVRDVPAELEQLIGRCLRKNPDDRWQTMREAQTALAELKQRSDSGALTVTHIIAPPPAAAPAVRKKTPLAAILAVAGIVLAAAAGGWWWKSHRADAQPVAQALPAAPATQPVEPVPPPPVAPAPAIPADQPSADTVLTNQNVVDMVEAKISQSLIVSQIRSSKTNFSLSTAEVIRLAKSGVPEGVIEVMRNPSKPAVGASAASGTPRTKGPGAPVQPPPQTSAPPQPAAVEQPAAPVPAPPPPAEPAAPALHPVPVADGLPFPIRLLENVPAGVEAGQPLRFVVSQDFRVGSAVVVAKGAVVTGSIVETGKKKFLGKNSKPTYRLEGVNAVDGGRLNLRAVNVHHPDGKPDRPLDVPGRPATKDMAATAGSEFLAYVEGAQTVSVRQ